MGLIVTLALALGAADNADVVRLTFDAAEQGETPGGSWAVRDGALEVRSDDEDKSSTRAFPLPVDQIAGRLVTMRVRVRAENVSAAPNSWNGVKAMLVLERDDGCNYPQLGISQGTFDWGTANRTLRIPADLTKARLVLGLEKVTGTVWFDDVSIYLGRAMRGGKRQDEPFAGDAPPRLRGVMHGPNFNEENIRHLAEDWNANQIRWQLNWSPMKEAEEWAQDLDAYDEWLDGALVQCDKALDTCERYGIYVLVDLHTPPGGRVEEGRCRLFREQRYQDHLVKVWDRIARRYKGRDVVYAYDLLNEPVEGVIAPGLMSWHGLATRATQAIRTVDPGKPVVFEPAPWGGPDGFDRVVPLDADRVIYSLHMYHPHAFTHQGVHGSDVGLVYPGDIDGGYWDKERLRNSMLPAIEFQRDFNVRMYVGEFSAIRWAPDNSAYRYLRDVIDLFEEYGWDWSYHAYREWPGWSVEHGSDPDDTKRATEPTDREKLLTGWFKKNARRPRPTSTAE